MSDFEETGPDVAMEDEPMTEATSTGETEEPKKPLADVDPNAGYEKGKYAWSVDGEKTTKAANDVLGSKISDYAWGDGEKKASIYVSLDGLDELPDDAIELKLVSARAIELIITFATTKRILEIKDITADVDAAKLLRKKGKNQVVVKLTKKKVAPWYSLTGKSNVSDDYDFDDDDDEPMDSTEDFNTDMPMPQGEPPLDFQDDDAPPAEDVTDAPPAEDVTDAPPVEDVTDAPPVEDVTDTSPAKAN
ncbi:hypothetical protein CTAYLR_005312 [Chrysophaeum taylorii]|uniref:CS domain-containing protein n=1 Tax=Chrysophaeum taylorii TaxID=2483200 RepID=A0AAD7ULN5_9STRA|nr:hypothetical protein CTAYLR_005312 [Chrysophaeum taylorii]